MRDDAGPLSSDAGRFYDPFISAHKSTCAASAPGRMRGLLAGLGIDHQAYASAQRRAVSNGTDVGWELVCAGKSVV